MSPIIPIFATFLVAGTATSVGLVVVNRKLKEKLVGSVSETQESLIEKSEKVESAIQRAVAAIEDMVPLEQLLELEKKKKRANVELKSERERLGRMENSLGDMQRSVDGQEARHNELKQGKEECQRIADDLRANNAERQAEYKRLESQLEVSIAQMDTLADEVDMTAEQRAAMAELNNSLENSSQQLKNLAETYEQASARFLNLQNQYDELEKEFRKLVDKELSGEL